MRGHLDTRPKDGKQNVEEKEKKSIELRNSRLNNVKRKPMTASEVDKRDKQTNCQDIQIQRVIFCILDMSIAFLISAMNIFAVSAFQTCSPCQRKRTNEEKQIYEIKSSLAIQFLNIGFVVFLANCKVDMLIFFMENTNQYIGHLHPDLKDFNMGHLVEYLPIFNGYLYEMSVSWYQKVGRLICMTVFAHIIIMQGFKMWKVCR